MAFYDVNPGVYYIYLDVNYYQCNGTMKMVADFPSNNTPATKSIVLTLTMDKGDSIKLGAIIEPKDAEKVKWTSSNKDVATVSSKGKVTAVSKGEAYVTAKSGSKKTKIKIIVE